MTIRHLKVFVEVCENSSITKTAEIMHIAQPAISQTIADIEKYYNVILFNRINQRLVITETGKILLQKAKEVIANFDEFENLAIATLENPIIHIGASLTFGITHLPRIMNYVKQNYPNVQLLTTINNSKEIEQGVLDGTIDFGIVEGSISNKNIKIENFIDDKLLIVCGYDYPINSKITITELAREKLLLREKGSSSRDHLEHLFNLNGKFFVDSHVAICRLNKELLLPLYALYQLYYFVGFKNIEKMATGQSGQIELAPDTIGNIKIPVPSIQEQKRIVTEIMPIEEEIEKLQKEIDEIPAKKQAILDKYLK